MKFLLTMNLPYTRSYGGANRSNRSLAEHLVELGHSVYAVVPALASPSKITLLQYLDDLKADEIEITESAGSHSFNYHGVWVQAVTDPSQLRQHLIDQIGQIEPDWILVSSEDPTQNLLGAALEIEPSRVIYLAHTPQMFPFGPASLYPGRARAELVARAASVITISNFVSDYFRRWAGVDTFLNHPPHYGLGPFPQCVRHDAGYVLLMNACDVKGISIFLALARRMPKVAFAALPGYGTTNSDLQELRKCPNVTIFQNKKNLDDLFSQTSVLLMPSLWAEGFGMAVVDAMLRGVPVIGSDLGGIPEAKLGTEFVVPVTPIVKYQECLGENLLPIPIVPAQNIEPWEEALRALLYDKALHESQSVIASQKAHEFVRSLSVLPLELYLKRLKGGSKTVSHQDARGVGAEMENNDTDRLLKSLSTLTSEQLALLNLKLKYRRSAPQISNHSNE